MPLPSDSPEIRAMLDAYNLVLDSAEHGRTFHDLDDFVCTKGHDFLQEVPQQKLQEKITTTEKTAKPNNVLTVKKTITKDTKAKTVAATHGHISLNRNYRHCSDCEKYSFPVVVTIGIENGYTESLERLATRCCGHWSYRLAAETLKELCGVQWSHTTIGDIADRISVKLAAKMENNSDIREAFQKAKGKIEFYADGVFVHIRTAEGPAQWMELKVGAFTKRLRDARRNGLQCKSESRKSGGLFEE